MKLYKLYCNQPNFKNIQFNTGVNVIYADVKTRIDEDENSHNLGKTLLIELIDILLLKGISKKEHFFYTEKGGDGKLIFENYIFYLEILLNDGKFLTIKRSVKANTKISFSLNDSSKKNDFTPPENWDESDWAIDKAKIRLGEYLDFGFFKDKDYEYRKAIDYCLRRQGDYQDIYRLTKFTGKDIFWKPFMFDLLGFNGDLLKGKYELDEEIKTLKQFILEEEKNFAVKSNEKDEIIGQIQIKTVDRNQYQQEVDNFNFYNQDKEAIQTLVDEVESSISNLNGIVYNLEFDINKIQTSIKNDFSFDLKQVEELFGETKIYFPEALKKEYQELVEFNTQITKERNKLLKDTLKLKVEELERSRKELYILNEKRGELLGYFQETSTFKKFKSYQKSLIRIEGELLRLNEKLNIIDIIGQKENEIRANKSKIEEIVNEVKVLANNTSENQIYTTIRGNFSQFYKDILNEHAIISWAINSNGNVDFKEPKVESKGDVKKFTQQDKGYTYSNLFCVAFDLAILTTYSNQSFYRFVYHDDVFANKDRGVKNRLLNLINAICLKYDIQYIFNVIKDDLPLNDKDDIIYFSPSEIILNLHDKDASGTLFGFKF